MMIYIRLAIEQLKKMKVIREVIIFLYALVFLSLMSLVSAVEIKLRDFSLFDKYLDQNGVLILSHALAKSRDDGGFLLRDSIELSDYIEGARDVLCMEKVWETKIDDKDVDTYCYSGGIIDLMNPEMENGRWFVDEDKQSEVLKVVVSYNDGRYKAGDRVILYCSQDTDIKQEIEIIGVLKDRSKVIMCDKYRSPYEDYRDCYCTLSYEQDKKMKIFLSDAQIHAGEAEKRFPYLNFRISPDKGFQKQMGDITIVTFDDSISTEMIDDRITALRELSYIYKVFNLKDVRRGSILFVTEDLKMWMPLIIFLALFDVVALMSVNTIMTKKMMGRFAVFFLCGFTWRENSKIMLMLSVIESIIALIIATILKYIFDVEWIIINSNGVDIAQILVSIIAGIIMIVTAHVAPVILIGKTSVKGVLAENSRGGIV